MVEIKAPSRHSLTVPRPWIFLCGSIEMGAAEKWQDKVVAELSDVRGTVFNPRRDDWDSSWTQSINNLQFFDQVSWELDAQENADVILVYFAPFTKSPITLLELGLFKDSNMLVVCPERFWRKGNVDIVCQRYSITQVESLDEAIARIKLSSVFGR